MKNSGNFAFVIQKHKATQLHFDFRLEIGDTMPSWSIPKGPTRDPKQRRLAMVTSDHDMEYRDFEGVIVSGYGAGTVMIWDEGTFNPEIEIEKGVRKLIMDKIEGAEVLKEGLKKGELKFTLYGKKMHGSFALVKTRGFGGKTETWLMIKHKDEFVQENYDAKADDISATTGRTMDEITNDPKSKKL
ncbi:hypothetical protein BH09PAT2_BH09PAT2_03050 [soil metagenome]